MQLTKDNCYKIKTCNVVKTEDDFIVKPIICVIDEMSEIMDSPSYKMTDSIKNSISSIARLGRAAACHLCLAALPEDVEVVITRSSRSKEMIEDTIRRLKEFRDKGHARKIPEYFKQYSKEEITEHIGYLEKVVSENTFEDEFENRKIFWKDVCIGDIIGDAVVTYITDWFDEDCYRLTASDQTSIVASKFHLFKVIVIDNSGDCINRDFELSKKVREEVKETSDDWIAVEDIVNCLKSNKTVILPDGNLIIKCDYLGTKKVRCIQTTTGEYAIETEG